MQLTEIKKNEDSTVNFKMTFDSNEVDSIRFEVYKGIKPRLNLNGFRKGKVPIQVAEKAIGIDKMYGNKLRDVFSEEADKQCYEIFAIKSFDIIEEISKLPNSKLIKASITKIRYT